jgi:hypothetical protein
VLFIYYFFKENFLNKKNCLHLQSQKAIQM